jgi:hypothetical protein
MSRYSLWVLLAAVLLAGFCTGCQKTFTRPRYDTIHVGMSEVDVERTLGAPNVRFSDGWRYVHDEPYYKAVIQFREGRVTDKSWYDEKGEMGDHPDSKWRTGEKAPQVGERRIVVE